MEVGRSADRQALAREERGKLAARLEGVKGRASSLELHPSGAPDGGVALAAIGARRSGRGGDRMSRVSSQRGRVSSARPGPPK